MQAATLNMLQFSIPASLKQSVTNCLILLSVSATFFLCMIDLFSFFSRFIIYLGKSRSEEGSKSAAQMWLCTPSSMTSLTKILVNEALALYKSFALDLINARCISVSLSLFACPSIRWKGSILCLRSSGRESKVVYILKIENYIQSQPHISKQFCHSQILVECVQRGTIP